MRLNLDALVDHRRFPQVAAVTSGVGKPAEVRFGVEGGEVVALTPPAGGGFRMNSSQVTDMIAALQILDHAAQLQRQEVEPGRASASRRAQKPPRLRIATHRDGAA